MIKISIIVAVFNDEKHIAECLDSLVEQTLHDIQIICIDDCSTDNSLSIVKQYAARDKRIEVISLEANQGQAKARNIGLKIAKGQYITFLDSDDWFSKDALEKALDTFEQNPLTDSVLLKLMLCTGNHKSIRARCSRTKTLKCIRARKLSNFVLTGRYMEYTLQGKTCSTSIHTMIHAMPIVTTIQHVPTIYTRVRCAYAMVFTSTVTIQRLLPIRYRQDGSFNCVPMKV